MAKEPHQKTNAELAQDLSTRPDSLIHLTAKAEMARRAAVQDQWRSWIMFASVVIAALAAAASPARLTSPISVRSISENVRTPRAKRWCIGAYTRPPTPSGSFS